MTASNTDFFYIQDNKVILKEQGKFPEREIGQIKESEAETITYFEERYKKLVEKVDAVQKQIEEQDNKGSFLQKVINLQNDLDAYDGIGDFISLDDRLNNLQLMLEDYIKQNRKRNLEVKNTLIAEAKSYAANPNWKEATESLKELRQRWIKVGAVDAEHTEEVESDFQSVYDDFYKRKKDFHEAKQVMITSRINQYEQLIEKAEKLNADKAISEDKKREKAEKLIAEWKSFESIPKSKYDELLAKFKKLTNAKSKKSNSKKSSQSNNKEIEKQKIQLVEQLKELAQDKDLKKAVESAKTIQDKWKSLGRGNASKQTHEEYFKINDYIFEKHFLETLFERKAKKDLSQKDAVKLKMSLLRDLISRDKKELLIFEENMGKFNLDSSKIDKMVTGKHDRQKRKLTIKERLLNELREENKNLK